MIGKLFVQSSSFYAMNFIGIVAKFNYICNEKWPVIIVQLVVDTRINNSTAIELNFIDRTI